MKRILLSLLLMLIASFVSAQPLIEKEDMPVVGDTIRLSITNNAEGIDYTLTGADYLWDFSTLTEQEQRVDTFVNVMSVPYSYYVDFVNPLDTAHKATTAQPQPDITTMPNVQFTEVYHFFRASDYTYTQVGQASKLNSIPTPIKYNDPDLLYTFPLTYNATDSSQYEYHLSIPSLGYYGETKKRVNVVDGWGTLITPFDTFPAIRVTSTSYIHDTIYLDTIGYGFAQDRTEIEYKWLTDTIGLPALRVLKRAGGGPGGGNVSLEYKHRFVAEAVDTTGTNHYPYTLTFFSLYPNPLNDASKIYFALSEPSWVKAYLTDITGRTICTLTDNEYPKGFSTINLNGYISDLSKGVYLINISAGSNTKTIRFTIP